jgi:hypothetical protein
LLLTAGSPREGGYHVKMRTTDNALVSVDLSEINDKAMLARAPTAHHPITAALKACVEVLKRSQNLPAGHRGRL